MNSASTSLPPQHGILTALWLPTDADGQVMRRELAANIRFVRDQGVHGVLAHGSTGEFPQFDLEQRKRILATVAELASPLPVVANVSDIRPGAVAELGRCARDLGLPAIAIMAPGFFPKSQDDLLEHFLRAADASGLPTFLYNFPEITNSRIDLETVAAFADRGPMAGIKQSGGEFEYHKDLVALGREKGFSVFSGSDMRLPEVYALGGAGCVGALANFVPELMVHLHRVCHDGMAGDPQPAYERLKRIGESLDRLPFPLNIAASMEARGLCPGVAKALVSASSQRRYEEIVVELRDVFETWGLAAVEAA